MQKFRLEELRVRVILIKNNTFDNPNILTKDEFLAMVRPKDKEKLKESKEKITNDFNKSIKDAGIRFGGNLTRKLTISPISLLEPSISLEISESKNKNKKRT
jgi:acetamidase/formamidase